LVNLLDYMIKLVYYTADETVQRTGNPERKENEMLVMRGRELEGSGTKGNFAGGLATPSRGATEVSVIRQRQGPGAANPPHSHDREEVMVVLSGTVRVTAEKEGAELSAGDALIVPANVVHQIETIGETEAEWLLAAPAGVRFLFAHGREASPPWSK
jgi:quercetin dioxygenase-like cupin family protein